MNITRRLANKSWQKLYRNRHLTAKKLNLSDQEFRLWDLYGAVSGWDKKYEEIFQAVHATDEEIAGILGWSSSKTCRTRNGLIKKGVMKERTRGVYEILLIPSPDSEHAKMQDKNASTHVEIAEVKEVNADLQPIQGKNDDSPIFSSRGVYTSLRTREEYEDIKNIVDDLSNGITEADGWLSNDPKMKAMVDEQQRLAGLMLMYEIENDLLPI